SICLSRTAGAELGLLRGLRKEAFPLQHPQQRVGQPAGARARRQAGMGIHGLVPESGDDEEAEVRELRLQLVDETGSSPLAHERQQVVVYRLRIDVVEIWDILPVTAQRAVRVEILPEGIHLGHDHSEWGRYPALLP